jgi:hypothetical protein
MRSKNEEFIRVPKCKKAPWVMTDSQGLGME